MSATTKSSKNNGDNRNNGNNATAATTFSYAAPAHSAFEEAAALRSFMLQYARYSDTSRASLAASAIANRSGNRYSNNNALDLAFSFNLWDRGADPGVTQREWVSFFSAVYSTGARAYWQIAKGSGVPGAAAPECCSVLAPGLVEIARVLPQQFGQAPIELSLEAAELEAVRFDAGGQGVEETGVFSSSSNATTSNSGEVAAVAALSAIDLMFWGWMKLGTLCGARPPLALEELGGGA